MITLDNRILYTVSEYKSVVNISKQAVYQQIKKGKIETEIYQGTQYIVVKQSQPNSAEFGQSKSSESQSNSTESQSKSSEFGQSNSAESQPKSSESQANSTDFVAFLIEQNRHLTEQNAQLQNKLLTLTEELTNIAKNSQIITAQAQTLQLAEKNENTDKKKGLFGKIFKRGNNDEKD